MTKEEMTNKLEELGVVPNPELNAKELKKLLKTTKEEIKEEESVEEEEEPIEEEEEPVEEEEKFVTPEPITKDKKGYYAGKKIIKESVQVVNGKKRRFVSLEGGDNILI